MKESTFTTLMAILLVIPFMLSFALLVGFLQNIIFSLTYAFFEFIFTIMILCLALAVYLLWIRQNKQLTS